MPAFCPPRLAQARRSAAGAGVGEGEAARSPQGLVGEGRGERAKPSPTSAQVGVSPAVSGSGTKLYLRQQACQVSCPTRRPAGVTTWEAFPKNRRNFLR